MHFHNGIFLGAFTLDAKRNSKEKISETVEITGLFRLAVIIP
jgi:hypothetical protein